METKVCIAHFESYFGTIEDKRCGNRKVHPLINILFITLVGVTSGFSTFVEIEDFAKARTDYFKKYLDLTYGIPSHDTLGNVFAIIDPAHFAECFENWSSSLRELISSDFIALDGKSIRSSFDKPKNKQPVHLMNVWSSANRVCLAQMRCDVKSNEIIALKELLEKLDLDKCVVSADAMHCHKDTTKQITAAGADYVLGLKKNELKMYTHCVDSFANAGSEIEQIITTEKGHGRIETRIIDFIQVNASENNVFDGWDNVNGFVRITTSRTEVSKTTSEIRYYLASLKDIQNASKAVRYHWQIENNLHWVLDNAFLEDKCRVRDNNAGENFAYIRKIVLNLLTRNKEKLSFKRMMLKALLDEKYLETLLQSF